jgi:hypothetical protein
MKNQANTLKSRDFAVGLSNAAKTGITENGTAVVARQLVVT